MPILEFVTANLVVLVSALSVVRCVRWRGVVHSGVVATTWYFSQIVCSILFVGIVLQSINETTVLAINIVILVAVFALSVRIGPPLTMSDIQTAWQDFVAHVREVFSTAWVVVLASLMLADIGWMAIIGFLYPVYDYDGQAYHLVGVTTWLQAGRFALQNLEIWSNVYPQDTETFYAWLILFLHRDWLVNTGQIFYAVGGVLAVIGIARLCGLGRAASVGAGTLFFLTPIVIAQLTTNYVDVAFASLVLVAFYFIFRYYRDPALSHILFFGLAAGLMLGSKSSGVSFLGIDCVILLGIVAYHHRTRLRRISATYIATSVALVVVPVVLLGTFWYIRTWAVYGNPIYPFSFTVMNHTVFTGLGSVQALIVDPLVPRSILGQPLWKQLLISWTNEPPHIVTAAGSSNANIYVVDQRLGGFGPQWLVLELPALVAYAMYAVRKQRGVFLVFLLPFVALFLLQPASWWTRYVLFIVAPGAVGLACALERLRPKFARVGVQVVAVTLVLISVYVSSTQGSFSIVQFVGALNAAEQNTTLGYWNPAYAWVDTIPSGSHVGWVYAPDHWQIYPLYGAQLENKVFPIDMQYQIGFTNPPVTKIRFFAELQSDQIDYLFTEVGTDEAGWADADPSEFHLIDHTGNNRVYKVTLGASPALGSSQG